MPSKTLERPPSSHRSPPLSTAHLPANGTRVASRGGVARPAYSTSCGKARAAAPAALGHGRAQAELGHRVRASRRSFDFLLVADHDVCMHCRCSSELAVVSGLLPQRGAPIE